MANYTNTYAQQIYTLLAPLVGDVMAKGVIKSQVQKLKKTENDIAKEDLPVLVEEIRKGLVVFLGSDIAVKVADKIKKI